MKKLTTMLCAILLLLGMLAGAFSASAAQYTKDDIVEAVSTSAIYKYISGDIINLARTMDATDAQINELYAIAERFADLKLTDKKASADNYTVAEINAVMALIDEACKVLDLHYTFTPSADPKHVRDVIFNVYDADNKLVYSYDGDVIKKTGADQTALYVTVSALGCILLAGAAAFAVKNRKARV